MFAEKLLSRISAEISQVAVPSVYPRATQIWYGNKYAENDNRAAKRSREGPTVPILQWKTKENNLILMEG